MDLRQKLDSVNEEIEFLEEISQPTEEIEEKLENLRLIRHQLERNIHYDQITKAPANQEGC
jgi:hypothetical protein